MVEVVANLYYGQAPDYNYWNGCSTGGHQGYALAQTLAGELDGILANAPAMYWTRFQTAQMWGQIAMYDIAHEVIAAGKLAAVQNAAIAACDKNDGVQDGIIDDPRTCTFNAKRQYLRSAGRAGGSELSDHYGSRCGQRHVGRPAQRFRQENLVPDRSRDRLPVLGWKRAVWARPSAVWMGSGRSGLLQRRLFPTSYPGHWGNVALNSTVSVPGTVTTYAAVAQAGSNNVADLTDTFDDLDAFKDTGGKMITIVGTNDGLIMPRGVINYYRVMAARYAEGSGNAPNTESVCALWRRPEILPSVPCPRSKSLRPWHSEPRQPRPVASGRSRLQRGHQLGRERYCTDSSAGVGQHVNTCLHPHVATTLTRPLCPYPQTAVYNGSGRRYRRRQLALRRRSGE